MLPILQHSESQTESTLACVLQGEAHHAGQLAVAPLLVTHVPSTTTRHWGSVP